MKISLRFINFIFTILLISCQPMTGSNTPQPTATLFPNASSTPQPTATQHPYVSITSNGLSICKYENIAFIGGSITGGSGASEKSMRYASKVGEWFIGNCSTKINIKNISITGTGSDFATYRLEHDLGKFIPDIAFYEFAVNDQRQPPDYINKHIKALIYKLRRMNPQMIIFSVLTTRISHMEFYKNGILPPKVDAHLQAASAMNIPVINVGQDLWSYVIKNGKEMKEFIPDSIHPNDSGHQQYYESIVQFLESYFNLPADQYSGDLSNATLSDMSKITSTSCEKKNNVREIYLHCDKGDWFTTFFVGDVLGIVGRIRSDGGRLECVVDTSERKTLDFWESSAKKKLIFWESSDFWDGYAKKKAVFWDSSDFWESSVKKTLIIEDSSALTIDRESYFFPFNGLEKITHNLTCVVSDHKISNDMEESKGYIVDVFYFMSNP